jgi:hypothetical protein
MKVIDRITIRIYENDKWWWEEFKKIVKKHRTQSNALKELVLSYHDKFKSNADSKG